MTDQSQLIRWEIDARPGGQVARLTIDNDRKLNTLGSDLMRQFVAAIVELEQVPDLRAVVLAAEGTRAFIGGADIREMADLGPISARRFISRIHGCCGALRNLPVPVIAEIGGFTLVPGWRSRPPAICGWLQTRPRSGCRRCGSAYRRWWRPLCCRC